MQVPPRIEQGNITLSSIEKMASVFKSLISWVGFIILTFESNPYMRQTSLLVKLIFYHMRYVTFVPPRIEQGNRTTSSIEKTDPRIFKSFISWVGFIILMI